MADNVTLGVYPELFLIERVIGVALQASADAVRDEPIPDDMVLLLVRLAYAELLRGLVRDDAQACEADSEFLAALGVA